MCMVLAILNAVDVVLTLLVVGGDPSLEANPLMSFLIDVGGWEALIIYKTFLIGILMFGVRRLRHPSILVLFLLAGTTLYYLLGMSYVLSNTIPLLPAIRV